MVAPRAVAASQSSRISAPAPSAMTKPSRSASKGRDTPMLDRAVMFVKPWMPTGVMAASELPVMTASHRPAAIRRAAFATEWVPAAQAVTVVSQGPCQPWRMEIEAAPAFDIIIGTRNGETRRGPFSWKMRICSSRVCSPPTPVPKITPLRRGSAVISPA